MPLILIIDVDLLCCSNLGLALCPKLFGKLEEEILFCFVFFVFFFFARIMFDMLVIVAIPAYFGEFWPKLNEAIFLERKKELKKFVDMDYGR